MKAIGCSMLALFGITPLLAADAPFEGGLGWGLLIPIWMLTVAMVIFLVTLVGYFNHRKSAGDQVPQDSGPSHDQIEALCHIGREISGKLDQLTKVLEAKPTVAAPAACPSPVLTQDTKEIKPASRDEDQAEMDATKEGQKPTIISGSSTDEVDQALVLMEDREADHPGHLLKARELLLNASKGPRAADAYNHLAQVLFWLGDYSQIKSEKEQYHGEGVEYGKKAVELLPNKVDSHLWYAANMGSHGVARGIMSSLFYLGPIDKHGSRSMELDEGFFYGGPLRLMGRFYHQCPGWPIGKGDINMAVKLLEKAVEAGPEFLLNHLYLAEVYIAKRKKDRAKKLINEVLGRENPSPFPLYQKWVQSEAEKLLAKI